MGIRIHPMAAAIALAFSASTALAQTPQVMEDIVVNARRDNLLPGGQSAAPADLARGRASTSDTASLLKDIPGLSLYGAGGVSSLPAIHGLADDRLRIKVDGMDLVASCPNHMNPALSYVDPSNLKALKVYAGITPVSVGGDSIGGTIIAETKDPEFAPAGSGTLTKGEIGAFYRSNGDALGANLAAMAATETFSISYAGSTAQSGNYSAGGNFKTNPATGRPGHTLPLDEVGSSAYKTRNHLLGMAFRQENHLLEAKFGYQDMPYQYYPNQRMDLLDNEQKRFSLRYLGQFDWGSGEIRAYREQVKHFMEFGPDKKFLYTSGNTTQGMPMNTEGETTGISAKASIDLGADERLRIGAEYQHYKLNDWWPAVAGSAGMGPNEFININHGTRDRSALFSEWEKHFDKTWTSLLGVRYERVATDTGQVHGYGGMDMAQTADAARLNNADRSKTDHNWDITALARYTPDATRDVEFGLARKVRSPNLYERYTWSTASMMSIMNNYVGDGNGYVGNPDLKPETAYTASLTMDWHAADRSWELKATPYVSHVENYIDAVRCGSVGMGACPASTPNTLNSSYVRLIYANQTARLYGIDIAGRAPLASTAIGEFALKGMLSYTKGENRDTGNGLYNIMPLNTKLTLTHQHGGWRNAIEFLAVAAKEDVSAVRNEIRTGGYSLTHLRSSYTWQDVRIDFGIENLFDKLYALPTGGAYIGQGSTMSINPSDMPWGTVVPGMGRTFYSAINIKF